MHFTRIYLDTNVLIRGFEGTPDDPIANDLIGMLGIVLPQTVQAPFVTSHITMSEALVHPIRSGDLNSEYRYKLLLSASTHWMQVRQISQSVLVLAAKLRATTSLKLPDAIHMASAILTECSHFLTSDTGFKSWSHPNLPKAPEIIRPDQHNLDAIIQWLRS